MARPSHRQTAAGLSEMGKDFKIGLVCGLVLAVIALIWVASRPSLRTEARMTRSAHAFFRESPASAPAVPGINDMAGPRPAPASSDPDPGMSRSAAGGPVQQQPGAQLGSPGTPAAQPPNVPDMTVYERTEKIKTTRFHIVRKDETLSAISQQYYGSPSRWRHILEANRDAIKDANKIQPGTKLIIPD
jgi:nucleoid-associated protein YgaU